MASSFLVSSLLVVLIYILNKPQLKDDVSILNLLGQPSFSLKKSLIFNILILHSSFIYTIMNNQYKVIIIREKNVSNNHFLLHVTDSRRKGLGLVLLLYGIISSSSPFFNNYIFFMMISISTYVCALFLHLLYTTTSRSIIRNNRKKHNHIFQNTFRLSFYTQSFLPH